MEREANYAAVGAFVLVVVLTGALFVYWYSDTREHRDYNRYEIYFTGSVSGLDKGGAVRYLGVGVGRVVDMRVDPRDSSRVQVIVDVDARTPVSTHTVAELALQGITGLLYIDLGEDRSDRRLAPAVPGLKYGAHTLLSEAQPDVEAIVQRLHAVGDNLASATRQLDQVIAENRQDLRSFTHEGLPEIESFVREGRAAAEDISALANSLRENPTQLLYQPPERGVEIPR